MSEIFDWRLMLTPIATIHRNAEYELDRGPFIAGHRFKYLDVYVFGFRIARLAVTR